MQTLIEVYTTRRASLREAIAGDARLADYDLEVVKEHQPGRQPGWLKLRSRRRDRPGAINIEWDGGVRALRCRVVNRGATRPHAIIGDFVDYLLSRYRSRIEWMQVAPR